MRVRLRRIFCVIAFLPVLAAPGYGEEIFGRVYDKLDKPVQKPEVCMLLDSTRCVTGDDSGSFRIVVPSGIRAEPRRQSFQVEIRKGRFSLRGTGPDKLGLVWFGPHGRRLLQSEADIQDLPAHLIRAPANKGIVFLRLTHGIERVTLRLLSIRDGAPQVLEVVPESALPKRSGSDFPELKISKVGFKTRYFRPFSVSNNWVTLTPLGDSGYVRMLSFESDLKIERDAKTLHLTTYRKDCGPSGWDTSVSRHTQFYAFASGKLFIFPESTSCTGSRLRGTGTDILGIWHLEDNRARLPPEIISPICRDLPRDIPSPSMPAMVYRISEAKLDIQITGESCFGWEIFVDLRNFFNSDPAISAGENRCRGSKFINSRKDTATVTYIPNGSRDSMLVRFEFRNSTCTYVDPGLFADPPLACPEPWIQAQQEFFACIRGTGFSSAANPAPKRGRSTREPARDRTDWLLRPFYSQTSD